MIDVQLPENRKCAIGWCAKAMNSTIVAGFLTFLGVNNRLGDS